MSFTYDITTNVGKVRLAIGDTVEQTYESLTNEEIQLALDDAGENVNVAALQALEWRIARLTNIVSRAEVGINSDQGQKLEKANDLYEKIKRRVGRSGALNAYSGQVLTDRIEDAEADVDYEQPFARVRGDDYVANQNDPRDRDGNC